ncbi:MAG TPA: PIN domain-containing protein [Bryobacteraceae bacterium]
MNKLIAFLKRHRRIGIDTSIFIYELEDNPRYSPLAHAVFEAIAKEDHTAIASTVTMLELLVQPYRLTDSGRVNQYYGLLTTYPNLIWIAPDLEIADLAARFRAEYNLRTPDAIQASTCAHAAVSGFITNDAVFKRVAAFESLQFDDLLD